MKATSRLENFELISYCIESPLRLLQVSSGSAVPSAESNKTARLRITAKLAP